MAMQSDRLHNKRYLSWIKTSLSLLYLKQGVTEYSDATAADFHKAVSERVEIRSARAASVKCSSCTPKHALRTKSKDTNETTWRMNCRENVCNIWLEELLPYHEHLPCPHIAWENSDPLLWPTDSWELAKLFQPFGCKEHKSAKDSDATALLSMMKDCKFFNKVIPNTGMIEDIKEARNKCMHSNDMEINDADMKTSLTLFATFLKMPCFKKFQTCSDAAEKIEQLRDNPLDLSLNKELELEALNNKINEVKVEVGRIAEEAKHLHDDISGLRTTQESTSDDFRKVNERLSEIEVKLKEVKESGVISKVADLTCRLEKVEKRPEESERQIEDCYAVKLDKLESDLKDLNCVMQELLKKKPEESEMEGVQKELINLYNKHCQKVPIYPLRPSWKKSVEDLYVTPHMVVRNQTSKLPDQFTNITGNVCSSVLNTQGPCINLHDMVGRVIEQTDEDFLIETKIDQIGLNNLEDIFYSGDKLCKEIYIDGEMGTGKTTLCEYLVNLWVRSKTGPRPLTKRESVMDIFTLVFYISLREANSKFQDCNEIDSIILSQLKLNCSDLKTIMKEHVCLIIMDGLDELTNHSESNESRFGSANLPERICSEKCVYFTTSRPFKLELLARDLEGMIDRQIAMLGLEPLSQKGLVGNIVMLLNSETGMDKSTKHFFTEIRKYGLEKYLETPVFLTQLLGLWYDGKSLGDSMCRIYSNIIERQIELSVKVKRLPPVEKLSTNTCQDSLPDCFNGHTYCQKYKSVLFKVSKLAFDRLFDKTGENCLIFDHEQMEICGMNDVEMEQLLQMGMLTQHKVYGGITEELKSISFQHKSHQEFFCALYLSSKCNTFKLTQLFGGNNSNISSVFKIEELFCFICGMNVDVAAEMSTLFLAIASSDKLVQKYRNTASSMNLMTEEIIKRLQNLIIKGADEARKNNPTSVVSKIHDIHVSRTQENITIVNNILNCDTSDVRSMYMKSSGDVSFWPLSTYIQKLYIDQMNLTTCCPFTDNFSADHLVILILQNIHVIHNQLDCICKKLSSAQHLSVFNMWNLTCKTHMKNRAYKCKLSLDFRCHKKLTDVDIMHPNVDEINTFRFCVEMNNLKSIRLLSNLQVSATTLKELFTSLPHNGVWVYFYGLYGQPLRVIGDDARQVLDQIRQSPETNVKTESIAYQDDMCLIYSFSWNTHAKEKTPFV